MHNYTPPTMFQQQQTYAVPAAPTGPVALTRVNLPEHQLRLLRRLALRPGDGGVT